MSIHTIKSGGCAHFQSILDQYKGGTEPRKTAAEFEAVLCRPEDLHWIGGISQVSKDATGKATYSPKIGTFWIPAALDPGVVPEPGSKDWAIGKGIGKKAVSHLPICMAEMDDGSITDQLQRLIEAVRDGMPIPTALVLSGDEREVEFGALPGKSVHAFWALDESFTAAEVEKWQGIQRALIVTLGGDESIIDPCRRMRWGCGPSFQAGPWAEDAPAPRVQSVLWLGDRVSREALEAWAEGVEVLPENELVEHGSTTFALPSFSVRESGGTRAGVHRREDFGSVQFEGTDLRSWAENNITYGGELHVGCPFHSHRGAGGLSGGDAVLHHDHRGVWVRCFDQCGESIFDSGGSTTFSYKEKRVSKSGGTAVQEGILTTLLTSRDLSIGKYIPRTARKTTRAVLGIKAPKGSGKTEWISGHLDRLPPGPVLCITHRRSLAGELSRRLGLPDYRQMTGTIEGSAVVCLDSLRRVATTYIDAPEGRAVGLVKPVQYTVILDEVEQVLRHLFGGTMSSGDSMAVYGAFRTLIGNASRVIVADADLSALALDEIVSIRGKGRKEVEVIEVQTPCDWEYRWTSDRALHEKLLMERWMEGKRLVIPMMANEGAQAMAKRLKKARPDARVICITSDTMLTKEVKHWMEHREQWAQFTDAVVHSPSLGTGVSIDLRDHFDHVMPIFAVGVGTAQDAMQMTHRVRHPKDRRIDCYIPRGGQSLERDPAKISERLLTLAETGRRHASTIEDYAIGEVRADAQGLARLDPLDRRHFELYTRVLAYERQCGGSGGRILPALQGYWASQGLTTAPVHLDTLPEIEALTKEEEQEIKAERKSAREKVREEQAARIILAPKMTIGEARQAPEPKTREEADSIKAAYFEHFYGDAATPEVLAEDLKGKLRTTVRAYAAFHLQTSGNTDAVAHLDAGVVDGGQPTALLAHRGLKARVLHSLLDSMGVLDIMDGSGFLDRARARRVVVRLLSVCNYERRKRLEELGFTFRSDAAENPVQFVSYLLKKIGLRLSSTRKKGQEREYKIKVASVERMKHLSKAERRRILDRAESRPTYCTSYDEAELMAWLEAA